MGCVDRRPRQLDYDNQDMTIHQLEEYITGGYPG